MATTYYRAAFDSDIFNSKGQCKQSSIEKPSINCKMHPKDNFSSLSSYMITDPREMNIAAGSSSVLNAYQNNIVSKQNQFGAKHYLSKSQVEMTNCNASSNRPEEKCPNEKSAQQRKMEEFYGKDSLNYLSKQPSNYSAQKADLDDFNPSTSHRQRFSSAERLNRPSKAKGQEAIKRIQVTKRDAKATDSYNCKPQQPFEQKVNFLKSNIFDDPDIAVINSGHNVPLRERKIDTHVIKSSKRANSAEMDMIFDWRESKNNIWLSKYSKEKSLLSAKERKLNEIYGSLNQIDIENAKEPLSKQFYENKKEIESKAMEHFQGSKQDSIKKQVENMSSLNGTDFYQKNYQLNTKKPDKNEVVHSYEIDNISEGDIKQVKKYFINNGIHIYDTELHDFNMTNTSRGRISVKIRENANDATFQKNLVKAKDALKQDGLELKTKIKPTKSYINSIPQTLKWNDAHIEHFLKNRYEDSTDQRTHIKGYGNTQRKDLVTSIPYNLRYKNTLSKNNF